MHLAMDVSASQLLNSSIANKINYYHECIDQESFIDAKIIKLLIHPCPSAGKLKDVIIPKQNQKLCC